MRASLGGIASVGRMLDVSIEFDPFSFVVALIAVVISALAYRATRRAPIEARHQEHRDAVRAALKEAVISVTVPLDALKAGRIPDRMPAALERARHVLHDTGPRLPEAGMIREIDLQLGAAIHRWKTAESISHAVSKQQRATDTVHERVLHLSGQSSDERVRVLREELAEARDRLDVAKRSLDDERTSLARILTMFRLKAAAYTDAIDARGRGEARLRIWRRNRVAR